ncbi:MAG: AraC family transcriptional regulator [Cyanobacteria bacterium J06632_22]
MADYQALSSPLKSDIASDLNSALPAGMRISEYCLPPDELMLPAVATPTVCLTLGMPYLLWQQLDDQSGEMRSHPGQFSIVPTGLPSTWRWQSTAHILVLQPDLALLKSAAEDLRCSATLRPTYEATDAQVYHLAQLLRLAQRDNAARLYQDTLQRALMLHLLSQYGVRLPRRASSKPHKLSAVALGVVTEYIDTHLTEALTLEQLAGLINLSPNYFATVFKGSTGMTPHRYVVRQRLALAQQLLLSQPDWSIAKVAVAAGFADQSHLGRHMRRVLGVTPREFIRQS